MPAPAILRALSEMPAPTPADFAPPAAPAVNPAPPTQPAVQAETAEILAVPFQPQIPVEDWSPREVTAASSLEDDLVRTVAMSAAQKKKPSSRRFSFFR